MWLAFAGFGLMFVTAFLNKLHVDEIRQSMFLKRCVILGIIGGFAMGLSGIVIILFG